MASTKFISRFSPGRTDPKDLEAIFVQRQKLLQDAVERLRESALTKNKHHLLFIGQRGCGKTHLLALLSHRIASLSDVKHMARVAWLAEDETSTSLLDLLLRVYKALAREYPGEFPSADLTPIFGMTAGSARKNLESLLLQKLGDRSLLVLVENLDELFKALDETGQRSFRAFIQDHPVLAIVATSQRIFDGVAKRESPFFGFFQTEYLQPLTVEEASMLLGNIAILNKDAELAAFLTTPRGRSRVRALHHLSGGNHRIYIILSEFMTRESLDRLVEPFEQMVDDLTPYYQERIRWLAPQQRRIVEFLCTIDGTVPVKDIARQLFATHQTIASQLKDLREMGYVESHARGRESLYELSEPLMRLCVEVKETKSRQPLRLIVDFLRIWYDADKLETHLSRLAPEAIERDYVLAALEKNRTASIQPRLRFLLDDLENCSEPRERIEILRGLVEERGELEDWVRLLSGLYEQRDFVAILDHVEQALNSATVAIFKSVLFGVKAAALRELARNEEAHIADYSRVIEDPNSPVEYVAKALVNRGVVLGQLGRYEEEIADYSRVVDLPGSPVEPVAKALFNRGVVLNRLGRSQEEISDYSRVIDLPNSPIELVANALVNRGLILDQLGRSTEAISDYSRAIDLPNSPVETATKALFNRGVALNRLGCSKEEVADYGRVIDLPDAPVEIVAKTLFNRGVVLSKLGRNEDAIADYSRVIDLPNSPVETVANALLNRGAVLNQLGHSEKASADFSRIIELPGSPTEQVAKALVNRGFLLERLGHNKEGITDYSRVIEMPDSPVQIVTSALINRGLALGRLGRSREAMADCSTVSEMSSAPKLAKAHALSHWALLWLQQGEWNHAIARLENALDLNSELKESFPNYADDYIDSIARASTREEAWKPVVDQLFAVYAKQSVLSLLGEGLVRSLGSLRKALLNEEGLRAWSRIWKTAGKPFEQLKIPLRIFAVGIEFLIKSDANVLLDLAKEERQILRDVLGLDVQK